MSDSWVTPKALIRVLGPFDLDPCASLPQPWPCAAQSYQRPADGLLLPWCGRVWLHPPASQAERWLSKLARHGRGTALVFARTDGKLMRSIWERATAVLLLYGRVTFYLPGGAAAAHPAGAPSALVAYGADDADQLAAAGRLPGAFVRCAEVVSRTSETPLLPGLGAR